MSTANKTLPKVVVILGPTATGKTKMAVKLATKFNGEIISADSRQVYCGMDIGTGKDLKDYEIRDARHELGIEKIKYHLINVVNPNQNFNVAKYRKMALLAINNILQRGKLPIVVGGTGLYISAIVDNYDIPSIKPNEEIRKKLSKMPLNEKVKLLKKLDSESLKFMDLKNPRRLDRALEVCLAGYKFSELRQKKAPLFDVLQIGIKMSRAVINQRIDIRIETMLEQGLINETKRIIKKFGKKSVPLETIGYKEIVDLINATPAFKHDDLQKIIALIKIHTHQFAKRQMTWFKRDKRIVWIKNYSLIAKKIKEFLKK